MPKIPPPLLPLENKSVLLVPVPPFRLVNNLPQFLVQRMLLRKPIGGLSDKAHFEFVFVLLAHLNLDPDDPVPSKSLLRSDPRRLVVVVPELRLGKAEVLVLTAIDVTGAPEDAILPPFLLLRGEQFLEEAGKSSGRQVRRSSPAPPSSPPRTTRGPRNDRMPRL